MKRAIVIGTLVLALLAPAAPVAAWSRSGSNTPAATQSVTQTHEMQALQYISDHVALLKIPLSPFMKNLLNSVIKAIGPALCPTLAGFAAPAFQSTVTQLCQSIVTSPAPLGVITQSVPMLCSPGLGEAIFPDFKSVLPILCGLLL